MTAKPRFRNWFKVGPEHNRRFIVQAMVGPVKLCTGEGRTKQAAGQDAAYKSIVMLKENPKLLQEM